ncbi:MAG: AAA domain-containing protein [Dehalococcoidia bacterium]
MLLVPVTLAPRGRADRKIDVRRAGDMQVNLVLLYELRDAFGIELEADVVLPPPDSEAPPQRVEPDEAFARLRRAVRLPGFAVTPRMALGNFSYQKMAMVRDLEQHGDALARHTLIAAIAGAADARREAHAGRAESDPRDLDRVPPGHEFLVLDADSSQQRVVNAALALQDGVVQGPPGTGKSQTIANIITTMAAHGRRVLFVAEKRAALDVVLRRLEQAGLGHLALDLHGADISRREVMKRLADSLGLIRAAAPVDSEALHRDTVEQRTVLNEHARRLHTPLPPSRLSVFDLQGRLLRMPDVARCAVRWRGATLAALDTDVARAARALLIAAGGNATLFLRSDPSPWCGAPLTDGAAAHAALDLAARLAGERLPALRAALTPLAARTGHAPATIAEAAELVALLCDALDLLARYDAALFDLDLDATAAALAPAERGGLGRLAAALLSGSFRRARRTIRALRHAGPTDDGALPAEARAAAFLTHRWRERLSLAPVPFAVPEVVAARAALDAATTDLAALAAHLGAGDLLGRSLDDLALLCARLAADTATPTRVAALTGIERRLEAIGLGPLVAELRVRRPHPEIWPEMFDFAWLRSCLDDALAREPALAVFNGRAHDRAVQAFRRLDRERLAVAAARVRRQHAERAVAAMNAHPDQEALVRREAAKSARHLPLRRLLAGAPDVLPVLRPCWMASPLSVSQLLPADLRCFDLVIFDEASQVLPEDAIAALLRADHAVVAGDRHQLPPTTFFAAGDDAEGGEDEEAPAAAGFESLLDLMSSFLEPWWLEWHYRSRDETLISFSNHHIYGDRLVTFPSAGGQPAISHALVPQVAGVDGQEESAPAEVRRVVDLVLEHAASRPDNTLGVIAMGIKHAQRIEAALDAALEGRPDLDEFFDEGREERFFVKNLERVQGDERDAIILSVGYGKDRAGRLPYRFGPLLNQGGERRLNVAVTRARRRMTVVSSFDHHDMDPGRSHARGVETLRRYLEFAASGGRSLATAGSSAIPPNPFEADVQAALEGHGLRLLPQWGAGRYRIDLVVQHPAQPGRFVLAIECDGASYHAAPTARDRDRLRQQHLEALGWRFHRIWSTDWFSRREEEIERTLTAYRAALAATEWTPDPEPAPDPAPEAPPVAAGAQPRAPRPPIPRRAAIADYAPRELMALVPWLESDGRLRTDELLDEMIGAASRSGAGGSEAAIRAAIAAGARAQRVTVGPAPLSPSRSTP